ncbi:MAG: hypothetical protein HYR91_02605 [Flavobacteriia bacterium]|nr:hypothetical protein [Flavobacteriia bacterium]
MKQIIKTLAMLFIVFNMNAQTNFNTGDQDLDKQLVEINNEAKNDLTKFKTDLLNVFKIPFEKTEVLLKEKMEPAEILLSAKIASISKKSLDQVITCYKTNKSKGWGYIAKEMGIKPGSPEFHELKKKKEKGNSNNKGKGKKK